MHIATSGHRGAATRVSERAPLSNIDSRLAARASPLAPRVSTRSSGRALALRYPLVLVRAALWHLASRGACACEAARDLFPIAHREDSLASHAGSLNSQPVVLAWLA